MVMLLNSYLHLRYRPKRTHGILGTNYVVVLVILKNKIANLIIRAKRGTEQPSPTGEGFH